MASAEARAADAIGRAEAEGMAAMAGAYSRYGAAATVSLVAEALPSLAEAVAAPLGATGRVVILGARARGPAAGGQAVGGLATAQEYGVRGCHIKTLSTPS